MRSLLLLFCMLGVALAEPQKEASRVEVSKLLKDGITAFGKNEVDKARTAFLKVLELAPDSAAALSNLGVLELRAGNYELAEKHLKKSVRIAPESALAWLNLGILYCDRAELDAALAALSQTVLLDPRNPKARNYLAVTISKKGWLSGAESELRKAISLDPDYAEAHFNLALCSLQQSPPAIELARRHYQKALELGAKPDPLVEKTLNQANN